MTINKMSCEQDSVEGCSNSNIEPVEVNDVHQRKYFALKQKCEQLQQASMSDNVWFYNFVVTSRRRPCMAMTIFVFFYSREGQLF